MSKLMKRVSARFGPDVHRFHLNLKDQMLSDFAPLMGQPGFGKAMSMAVKLIDRPDEIPPEAFEIIRKSIVGFLSSANSKAVQCRKRNTPREELPSSQGFQVTKIPEGQTRKQFYDAYINSKAWYRRRLALFAKRGRRCESCGQTKGEIHVHHLTYERIGAEADNDLLVLCRECHVDRHRKH